MRDGHRRRREKSSCPSAVAGNTHARCARVAIPFAGDRVRPLQKANNSCQSAAVGIMRVGYDPMGVLSAGGHDDSGASLSPVEERFQAISAGAFHTCGLRPDGSAFCWGSDSYGQASASEGSGLVAVSAGVHHTCGLLPDGQPQCWGMNDSGQMSPPENERFASISCGGGYTCGLRYDGSLVCWGESAYVPESEAGPFVSISSGETHTCALRFDGSAVCWGRKDEGEATPPEGERFAVEQVEVGG